MEYIIIGILIVSFPLGIIYAYRYGKKEGTFWLLSILFKSGFDSKVAGFKKQNSFINKNGVVFVGDSITQDYNVYEYFAEHTVYNRGIGGDTTEGLLKRLDVSVFDLAPKTVVLLMGTNDFGVLNAKPKEIYDRMVLIINTIKNNNSSCKIVLQSVYPVNPIRDAQSVGVRNNHEIKELNKLYQSIQGISYVDVYSLLQDQDGNLNSKYTLDGLHVNQEGYEVITKELKKHLL